MQNKDVISEAKKYITTLFEGDCGGHDAGHTMRVYKNAMDIAENEQDCDREIIALAALLHDVDDYKLFHTENNANARSFLMENQIPEEEIERICRVINSVSFSQNRGKAPTDIEGKIVQDADRLDALGAIGIARTFAYGGGHSRSMEDSIQHFHDKLLLLCDEMNTHAAKSIAKVRHDFMVAFLEEFEKEIIIK